MDTSHWVLVGFLFALGTIVGSFLNVVVYRLPRGESLIFPGSRCPACGHEIRWYDNVPILGWLWLGGRCRDCQAHISARYPIVEFAVGLMFVAIGWTDWVRPETQAIAVQNALIPAKPAVELPPLDFQIERLRFAFHLILLCTLLAAALIAFDVSRIMRQLVTWPSAVGMLIAIGWPLVQGLPIAHSPDPESFHARLIAFATSFVGMAVAVVIRLVVFRFFGLARARETGLVDASLAIYAVGAFLGWQAALAIGLIAVGWAAVSQLPRLKSRLGYVRPTIVVFAATLVWCLVEGLLAGAIRAA
jgi:leader peptidase (prepilin peptidase) / N-methyltransferase